MCMHGSMTPVNQNIALCGYYGYNLYTSLCTRAHVHLYMYMCMYMYIHCTYKCTSVMYMYMYMYIVHVIYNHMYLGVCLYLVTLYYTCACVGSSSSDVSSVHPHLPHLSLPWREEGGGGHSRGRRGLHDTAT